MRLAARRTDHRAGALRSAMARRFAAEGARCSAPTSTPAAHAPRRRRHRLVCDVADATRRRDGGQAVERAGGFASWSTTPLTQEAGAIAKISETSSTGCSRST